MVSIQQLLLLCGLVSISQLNVNCQESAISSGFNGVISEKSLDSDGRRYFENRNDFPGFEAQVIPEETEVNTQVNTNVNQNTNLRVPWSKHKGKGKGRRRGFRRGKMMKEARRKQGAKQMAQPMARSALSQSSVTWDTNAVKENGRRTKCYGSGEEEDLDPDPSDECNCYIGSKILRQIRQFRYQLDVMENLVTDNFNFDEEF